MADVINVKSTVAQAEGFAVEVADSTLLCSRYFPTTDGDLFAGKEVLFDFEDGDLNRGAFLSNGYKVNAKDNWVANSVVPARVGESDVIDPTNQDRVIFERLCRAQGADVNRAEAYQNLLNLKSARLAKRTDRSREKLAALVLAEGKIQFDQPKNPDGSDTDPIVCRFFDPEKGANNHWLLEKAWTATDAKPYADICDMVAEGMKHGKRYTDLVMGASAWAKLASDADFKAFAGATFHSEGMKLDFGEVDGGAHVAQCAFNGLILNCIVYSGGSRNSAGELETFINPNAVILISEAIGRGLQGGCTLLNPDSVGYGIDNAFIGLTGIHMQSIYKDFNNQKLYIREESRPLPAPKHSVNECDWIYCDTSLSGVKGLGVVFNGIHFEGTGYTDIKVAVKGGSEQAITGTGKLYLDADKTVEIKVASGKITVPVDGELKDGSLVLYVG